MKHFMTSRVLIGLLLLLTLGACGGQSPAPRASSGPARVNPPPPDPVIAQVRAADVAQGEALFKEIEETTGLACASCHDTTGQMQLAGPGLINIAQTMSSRDPNQAIERLLYDSIVHTNAYIATGYFENIMPQVYNDLYSDAELHSLVAYLLTLG